MTRLTRRTVVQGGVGSIVLGLLAGCIGDDDDDDDAADDDDRSPEDVAVDWLSDAPNFDGPGDIVDLTGEGAVEVTNAPEDEWIFDPPAIRIDAGTEVTWVWDASGHDLTEQSGEGATITDWDDHPSQEGGGFEHSTTFDEAGVALYFCSPHLGGGQKGAVIVE